MKYAYLVERMHKLEIMRRLNIQSWDTSLKLHPGQLHVLEYIINHAHCTQIEIAEALHVTPAAIAWSTKRIQAAGLLEKEADPDNLRCNKLSITEKGRIFADKVRRMFDALDEQMLRGFSEEELHVFTGMLDRMTENLSAVLQKEPYKMDLFPCMIQRFSDIREE